MGKPIVCHNNHEEPKGEGNARVGGREPGAGPAREERRLRSGALSLSVSSHSHAGGLLHSLLIVAEAVSGHASQDIRSARSPAKLATPRDYNPANIRDSAGEETSHFTCDVRGRVLGDYWVGEGGGRLAVVKTRPN